MHIFNILGPIILIIVLGWLLRRFGFISAPSYRPVMRLVYWVGLPCLLFLKTATATVELGQAWQVTLVLMTGMVVCISLAFIGCLLFRFRAESRGTFVQGAYRGNLAYVGLPLILFSLSGNQAGASNELQAIAILAIAPVIPLYNAVAVVFLAADQQRKNGRGKVDWLELTKRIATNPLIIACVFGIGYAKTGWELGLLATRVCTTLGNMALPLALLGIGVSLNFSSLSGRVLPSILAAALKVAVAPAAGFVTAQVLQLSVQQTQIAVLFLACPTAITSYVMAQQMGSDAKLAGNIVLTSTVLAFPIIAMILAVFGWK